MKYKGLIVMLLTLTACQSDEITSVWVPKEEVKAPMAALSNDHPQIAWDLPSKWTEQPPADMRVGSFLAKGSNGQSVDISVVPLSGMAGGMLANINRWRGQIQLPPIEEKDLSDQAKLVTVGSRQMNYVEIVSDEPLIDGKYKKRIVAAIYEHQGQSWFFKMAGEDEAVKETKPDFRIFLTNLHFHE